MDKVLFITTRNILNTCGELRLIKNRAKALYDNWGIITDFIAASSRKKIANRNEEMGAESKVTPVAINISHPFSIFLSFFRIKKEIRKHMQTGTYRCLVLSGVGTLSYINYIRKQNKNIKIIADIHGSDEDMLELAKDKSILKFIRQRMIYIIAKIEQIMHLSKADALYVVSNGLVEYIKKEYRVKNPNCFIVPCAMDDNILKPELIQEYRNFYRNKYGIEKDDILFVYSGGVSPWQCIDQTLETFYDIKKNSNRKCKMLFLSHKIDEAMTLINTYSDVITDKVTGDDAKKVMCAGDYALLIRENTITNHVAYPNKFLEYVQSGMKIITTPFIYDVAQQVKEYDLGIVFDINKGSRQALYDYVAANHTNDYMGRAELLHNTAFGTTMKKSVEECFGQ